MEGRGLPDIDPSQLMESTTESLKQLLKETEEKSKYEMERISLEKKRIETQQEVLEKETEHNEKLSKLIALTQDLTRINNEEFIPVLKLVQSRMATIWSVQQTLIMFLIREYEKLNDIKYEDTIAMLKKNLKEVSDSVGNVQPEIHVIGNVSSEKDVNISSGGGE